MTLASVQTPATWGNLGRLDRTPQHDARAATVTSARAPLRSLIAPQDRSRAESPPYLHTERDNGERPRCQARGCGVGAPVCLAGLDVSLSLTSPPTCTSYSLRRRGGRSARTRCWMAESEGTSIRRASLQSPHTAQAEPL